MSESATARLLVIMGSGETAPTMVTTHRRLVDRLGDAKRTAVLLETPYGFQENADIVTAKAVDYFAGSVGLPVAAVPGMRRPADDRRDVDAGVATIRSAGWLFTGPGSPTYALRQWRRSGVDRSLVDRVRDRPGVTVFSSAAACTLGEWALPVYEIYKVGLPPAWERGLDVMGALGMRVAVIPHFDNAEGGNHDTRYCYLGETRLRMLEAELPADAAVLGVDEHTALIVDLAAGECRVEGRGAVTVRRAGIAQTLPAGSTMTLARLRAMVAGADGGADGGRDRAANGGDAGEAPPAVAPAAAGAPAPEGAEEQPAGSLEETVVACETAFENAAAGRDADGMARAILDLDDAIESWSADTLQSDATRHARQVLRSLVLRLAEHAREGLTDPRERLAPVVAPLLDLRQRSRAERQFVVADAVRDALTAGGVELRDTPEGTEWSVAEA